MRVASAAPTRTAYYDDDNDDDDALKAAANGDVQEATDDESAPFEPPKPLVPNRPLPPSPFAGFAFDKYYIELGILACFVAYGINYAYGSARNTSLATRWCA